MDLPFDPATVGVSVAIVSVLTTLAVQVIKTISRHVDALPTLSDGTTQLMAYLVAMAISYGLTVLGYGPVEQDNLANVLLAVVTALGGGLGSQAVYAVGKKAVV